MPLDERRCELILTHMKSMDIQLRLQAINEAKEHNNKAFSDTMSDKDYAYAAYFLESCYNLLREELKVKQIRIKADTGASTTTSTKSLSNTKAPTKKKTKPEPLNMQAMMASFMAFQKQEKEKKNVEAGSGSKS